MESQRQFKVEFVATDCPIGKQWWILYDICSTREDAEGVMEKGRRFNPEVKQWRISEDK